MNEQASKRLIFVGGGAFARELINWAADAIAGDPSTRLGGVLDASPQVLADFPYPDVPWLGTIEDYQPMPGDEFVMAIGDPAAKRRIAASLKQRGAVFRTIIHPTAVIARTAVLGEGVVVCPQSFVSADACVGDFVAINGLCSVGHDVSLGAYSTLSAHVDLTGWVQIGEAVFFGSGARVLPRVQIGDGARIGAGTLIMRKVPAEAVMYAPPAKKL